MKTLSKSFAYGSIIIAGLAFADVSRANLVVNGGFETTPTGTGAAFFPDWTLSGNLSYYDLSTYAHSGTYSAQIGPYAPPIALSQTITTTPGDVYDFSFWVSRDGAASDANTAFTANFGSQQVLNLVNPDPAGGMLWTYYNYVVQATSSSTTIQFTSVSPPSYFWLDDVNVNLSSVPEPSTVIAGASMLLPFGASFLGMLRRKRSA